MQYILSNSIIFQFAIQESVRKFLGPLPTYTAKVFLPQICTNHRNDLNYFKIR